MASKNWGLYRQPDKAGGHFPTFLCQRDVPAAIRGRPGTNGKPLPPRFKASTGETVLARAERKARELWETWGAEIAHARTLSPGPHLTVEATIAIIEAWRSDACA